MFAEDLFLHPLPKVNFRVNRCGCVQECKISHRDFWSSSLRVLLKDACKRLYSTLVFPHLPGAGNLRVDPIRRVAPIIDNTGTGYVRSQIAGHTNINIARTGYFRTYFF